jgi:cell division protein FtsA
MINRGAVPVLDPEGEIGEEDIEEVMDVAKAVNLPPDCEILHTICQHFTIDGQQRVVRPDGMEGRQLGLDMLVLYGVRNRMHNTVRVVQNVPLDVSDVVFSGLCSALAVLTPEQKKSGVLLIDLGGGTTEFVAYADNIVAAAGALGVGGDHVTNDIVIAFNIPTQRAERLKREAGSALIEPAAADRKVSLAPEVGFQGRVFPLTDLHTVINARVDEIFMAIRKALDDDKVPRHLGGGVVLAGGGARLSGIATLAEQVFGLPCTIGRPRGISGLASATDGPEYATCSGLIRYAFRNGRTRPAGKGLGGLIKILLGG